MRTETITNSNNSIGKSRFGYLLNGDINLSWLLLGIGGTGKDSIASAKKQHEAAGNPFPVYTMAIDTDTLGFDAFDFSIDIAPTRDAVSAMAANPQKYGVACRAIIEYHDDLLEYEVLGHGARTTRIITQAAFEIHEDKITKGLRDAIESLLKRGASRRVQPVVFASFGGGTGSAGVILLQNFFMDETKRREITIGLPPKLLAQPILFAIDPYAHVLQQTTEEAARKILTNIYATRVELAEYEKIGKGYQYCFHLGLGSDGGVIFSTIPQVCEANGIMAWEWMAAYPYIKGRFVDGIDFGKSANRFRGNNIPELQYYPQDLIPEYGEQIDGEISDESLNEQTDSDSKGVSDG